MNTEFSFEKIEEIGKLSQNSKGWALELNIIKWGTYAPKYDLRTWSPDHKKMGKGVTMTKEELDNLKSLLNGEIPPL